jgi:hypothetical protein
MSKHFRQKKNSTKFFLDILNMSPNKYYFFCMGQDLRFSIRPLSVGFSRSKPVFRVEMEQYQQQAFGGIDHAHQTQP